MSVRPHAVMLRTLREAASALILLASTSCAQAEIDPECPKVFLEATSWEIRPIYRDPSIFRVSSGNRSYVLGRDELAPFWPPLTEPPQVIRIDDLADYPHPLAGLKRSLEERCQIQVTIGDELHEIAPDPE